jgi:hypothetical protein
LLRIALPPTAAQARDLLPALRDAIRQYPEDLRLREAWAAALLTVDSTGSEEGQALATEVSQVRRDLLQWSEALPHRPLLQCLVAHPLHGGHQPVEQRILHAERAVKVAPWFFPAVRLAASAYTMRLQGPPALQLLTTFGEQAPLSPAVRQEFETRLQRTRGSLLR